MSQDSCDDEIPSKPPIDGNQETQARENHQQVSAHEDGKRAAINPTVTQPPSKKDQWREDQKGYWERQIRIAKWLNGITVVGGIIALGALIAVYAQLQMMKTSLRITERAWVTVRGVSFQDFPGIGVKTTVLAGLRNSGNSPALQMSIKHGLTIASSLPPENKPRPYLSNDPLGSSSILGSDSTGESTGELPVTAEDMMNLVTGKAHVYSFGIIEYSDIFDTKHWTMFCYRSRSLSDSKFVACPEWNEVDKN